MSTLVHMQDKTKLVFLSCLISDTYFHPFLLYFFPYLSSFTHHWSLILSTTIYSTSTFIQRNWFQIAVSKNLRVVGTLTDTGTNKSNPLKGGASEAFELEGKTIKICPMSLLSTCYERDKLFPVCLYIIYILSLDHISIPTIFIFNYPTCIYKFPHLTNSMDYQIFSFIHKI